ncbi:MAG TPA: hypothetical protein VIM41_06640 [Gammaproteobacteria bacterium]
MPAHLDGCEGRNRVMHHVPQIGADNDLAAIQCWLREYADSPQTYRSYRIEAERLLYIEFAGTAKTPVQLNARGFSGL